MPSPKHQPLRLPAGNKFRNPLPLPTFVYRNHLNRMLAVKILQTPIPRFLTLDPLSLQDMDGYRG